MEALIIFLLLVAAAVVLGRVTSPQKNSNKLKKQESLGSAKPPTIAKPARVHALDRPLEVQGKEAAGIVSVGIDIEPYAWRAKNATSAQFKSLNRLLKEAGQPSLPGAPKDYRRGILSDAIGVFVRPKDEEIQKAVFFGIPNHELMNETQLRKALYAEFQKPGAIEKWEARPPKSEYAFYGELLGLQKNAGVTSKAYEDDVYKTLWSAEHEGSNARHFESAWSELKYESTASEYDIEPPQWNQFERVCREILSGNVDGDWLGDGDSDLSPMR